MNEEDKAMLFDLLDKFRLLSKDDVIMTLYEYGQRNKVYCGFDYKYYGKNNDLYLCIEIPTKE
ncbi:MAG: hypothetical protein ABFD50_04555 [Smithella sp.]